jgi:hypothetical protein
MPPPIASDPWAPTAEANSSANDNGSPNTSPNGPGDHPAA